MVWYCVHKTGVPEIDMDHANIDYYLILVENQGLSPTTFDQLVKTLILHFEREEEICQRLQLKMSAEHLTEHRRLSQILKAIRFEEKSEQEHLLFFKQTLMSHVSEFDIHINSAAE